MAAEHRRSLSLTLGLICLITMLGSVLYGCGGSGSSSSVIPTVASGGGGGGGATPSPLSGLKATVVVYNNLSAMKSVGSRGRRTASASVPATATVFVYTGYDASNTPIYTFTGGRAAQQTLTGVPIEVTRIQVDYQTTSGQSVAFASFPVSLTAGVTVTVAAGLAGGFTMQVVNDSGVPDSDVYVLVAANPTAQNAPQVVSGCAVVNSYLNQFFPSQFNESRGHGTRLTNLVQTGVVASTTQPNKLNNVYTFTVTNLDSGRLYVTYGDNQLFTPTTPPGGTLVYTAPSADANFRWDVMEMTVPSASPYPVSYADLTSIQFLGIPMQIQTYADADAQQGEAQQASNSPQAGSNVAIVFGNTTGIAAGAQVKVADANGSEVATVSSVTTSPYGIRVNALTRSYTQPHVTLVGDTALQTRTFYASTPTILNALWGLTSASDQRMQWAFQYVGSAPAPTPVPSPTPTPSCSPAASPSPTPVPTPGPNVAQRGYPLGVVGTWLQPSAVGQPNAFLRVQGPETTVSETWAPAPSPNPALIVANDPSTFATQRPYRAYPYPTFNGYVSTMAGNWYTFAGANSCGGTATQWQYTGTVTAGIDGYSMNLVPIAAMSPDATLGCGAGSSSGVSLPTNLPVTVVMNPNDTQSLSNDLDFVVYSTPGGVFNVPVTCDLVSALDNSVYANIADNALAGLQFGYVNGKTEPADARVWFAGFPAFPPFGAARTTNDGLYNPYAAVIYNYSDSYGFPYSDRINQFNPLVTTTNTGVAASSTMRVTLLNDLRPDAPTNLQLVSGSDGTTVTALWNAATRNANDPTQAVSYTVTITDGLPTVPAPGPADRQTQVVTNGATTCTFTGLRPGTTYEAQVTATYGDGSVSSRSAKANVLTAGAATIVTAAAAPSPTLARFTLNFAWDGANLSEPSQFTLNVPGQKAQTFQAGTPIQLTLNSCVIGTNLIPFTVTTTNATYPPTVPPVPGAPSGPIVVDSGAFVVNLTAASATTFSVGSVYVTDGSPIVLPSNPNGPFTGPYNNDGTPITNGNGPLVLTATLAPSQAGNFQKVISNVQYAAVSPAPAGPFPQPSPTFVPPTPSATPCPAISFTPASGLPGSPVTISLFVNGQITAVQFNGVPAQYTATPPGPVGGLTTIVATVPYNPTVTGFITVATTLGATVTATPFTLQQPTFTVSPTSATIGQALTLTAQNGFSFGAANAAGAGGTVVQWQEGCTVGSDTSPTVSGSTIITRVPNSVAAGVNTLSVLLPNGLVAVLDPTASFTVESPSFTITPTSGVLGSTVTLTPVAGSSLAGLTTVTFLGSNQNPPATPGPNGSYTVKVPSDATTGTVTVHTGPNLTGTSTTPFTVVTPTFTVSPASGYVGTSVTLTADTTGGFTPLPDGNINVQFGSGGPTVAIAPPYSGLDPTQTTLAVHVPALAPSGTITVTGCSAAPKLTSSNSFSVLTPGFSASPSSGGFGDTIVLTSNVSGGFTPNGPVNVQFGSQGGQTPPLKASDFSYSYTTITTKIPVGAVTGPITVYGCTSGTIVSSSSFTVTHPAIPGATPFSPMSGGVGTTVTITGTGMNAASQVLFTKGGGTVLAAFQLVNATTVKATVPVGATTGPITVRDGVSQGSPSTAVFSIP